VSSFKSITEDSFEREVLQADLPVLVEFGAEWCVPCKRLEPILEKLVGEWGDKVRALKVDVDVSPNLVSSLNIMTVPTVMLFNGGTMRERLSGLQSRERLVEKFAPHLK